MFKKIAKLRQAELKSVGETQTKQAANLNEFIKILG
ncbi:hypothetical protein Nther_0388 [Natranaerobius thermophilus JW/NM-WN-LF]|uniref:Uncharacterized protein n=1 Tax=Natranaerobius thermophilus (strain ATCC BAA-1301 / DSM 18059 / JW/NM-WN-LF) TaxID=457570 RepID=B2A5F4_NATTJ|nr:hypothetical protein Nther_0388 [Natranaerobius thermophilus JW/NM-WN-LF]